MVSKTERAIAAAHEAGRTAFVGYLPLGFPDAATTVAAAIELANSGVDIIELGPPYSDPVMDGEVIQRATNTALANGFKFEQLFQIVQEITSTVKTPVLIMSYWNLILQYGVKKFAADLNRAGGAGLITPDITPECADEWIAAADSEGLDKIFLAAPSSSAERLQMIASSSRGFVYAVSTMGITGARDELDSAAKQLVARLKNAGAKYVCVGIGVSVPAHVSAIAQYADGAVVGTALVRELADAGVKSLGDKAAEFASATAVARITNS
ncbi:tryptophan synthase subunit alpha [Canibacter zhuwentaonis]|uniref:tryptophan synthase subunit alpha n=1 Tax=Canibacter zhuwentaonis TaxID=2837491 RepID=UPI00350EEA7F